MKTRHFLFLAFLLHIFSLTAMADDLQVVTTPVDGCFPIAGTTVADKAIILYDDQDAEVVQTVIDCLTGRERRGRQVGSIRDADY